MKAHGVLKTFLRVIITRFWQHMDTGGRYGTIWTAHDIQNLKLAGVGFRLAAISACSIRCGAAGLIVKTPSPVQQFDSGPLGEEGIPAGAELRQIARRCARGSINTKLSMGAR